MVQNLRVPDAAHLGAHDAGVRKAREADVDVAQAQNARKIGLITRRQGLARHLDHVTGFRAPTRRVGLRERLAEFLENRGRRKDALRCRFGNLEFRLASRGHRHDGRRNEREDEGLRFTQLHAPERGHARFLHLHEPAVEHDADFARSERRDQKGNRRRRKGRKVPDAVKASGRLLRFLRQGAGRLVGNFREKPQGFLRRNPFLFRGEPYVGPGRTRRQRCHGMVLPFY